MLTINTWAYQMPVNYIKMIKEINEAVTFITNKGVKQPTIGIILGTGLGGLVDEININIEIDYSEIPHFPTSTVESHSGKLIYGTIANKSVVAMQGRFHFYEGYSMNQIVFPVRVMKFLGVKNLLISNAAGAVNTNYKKGSLMMLIDHINLLPDNPLIGKNDDTIGPRFPDMSEPYSKYLNNKLLNAAKKLNINLHQGVYAAVMGPNLETRAEYRFIRNIGADAVGMSTIPEVIAANHIGLPCCAISVLTDECNPDNLEKVDIADILAAAASAEPKLTAIYKNLISDI